MQNIEIFLFSIFAILFVALLSAAIVYIKFFLNEKLRLIESEMNRIRQEHRGLSGSTIGLGQKISALENSIDRVNDIQEQTVHRDPEFSSYTHAIKMVEMGATHDDLVKDCGLSKAEADLVLSLHKRSA